jgi:uncharacterized membrane protein
VNPGSVFLHEAVVAPAALCAAWVLGLRGLGRRRAAVELVALGLYGFTIELVAMRVFRSHDYGTGWLLAPLGVPLAVAAVWAAVILAAMGLAARLAPAGPALRAATAALLGLALDLLMEPVAVRAGLWQWTPPGPWLGVPVGNFVGWALIVGLYAFGADRSEPRAASPLAQTLERLVLAALCLLGVVGVGLVWQRFQVESAFAGRWAWAPWALSLCLTVALLRGPRPGPGCGTLSGRLGAAPGPAAWVFLLVAGTFACDAVALRDRDVGLAAAGSLTVLAWLVTRASLAPAPSSAKGLLPRAGEGQVLERDVAG